MDKKRPPQPVFKATPKPKAKPIERKADDANGAPPGLKPLGPVTYWIWRDAGATTWHLRTTAAGKAHRFSGRIWVDGSVIDLDPALLETNDRLKKEDAGVFVFDFATDVHIDGFDFKVAAGRCVTFHLLVDEQPASAQQIKIGAKEISMPSATFRLCR